MRISVENWPHDAKARPQLVVLTNKRVEVGVESDLDYVFCQSEVEEELITRVCHPVAW